MDDGSKAVCPTVCAVLSARGGLHPSGVRDEEVCSGGPVQIL